MYIQKFKTDFLRNYFADLIQIFYKTLFIEGYTFSKTLIFHEALIYTFLHRHENTETKRTYIQ